MLKRLPSAASIASILRPSQAPASSSTDSALSEEAGSSSPASRSRSLSFASSALKDAIETPIVVSKPDALTLANHDLVRSLEALQGATRDGMQSRLELLARIQCILTDQVRQWLGRL